MKCTSGKGNSNTTVTQRRGRRLETAEEGRGDHGAEVRLTLNRKCWLILPVCGPGGKGWRNDGEGIFYF